MSYGWYLLDDKQKELIRSHLLRDVLPFGPFHVDIVVGNDTLQSNAARLREVLDELSAMNLVSISLIVEGPEAASPDIVDLLRAVAASGATIGSAELAALRFSTEVAHALLETEAHSVTVRFDVDANGVS